MLDYHRLYFRILCSILLVLCLGYKSNGQVTKKPFCLSYGNSALSVEKVELNYESTVLYLVYSNNSKKAVSISIDPYTVIKEKHTATTYTMSRAEGIAIKPSETIVPKNTGYRIKLVFPALSAGCTEFDLAECPNQGCFNVEGIRINNGLKIHYDAESTKKFRREYDFMALYDGKKWSDWSKGDYFFVFNINDNNDFRLYLPNGNDLLFINSSQTVRKSDSAGDYQETIIKDNTGKRIIFKLHDNGDITLVYPNGQANQFSNH